MTSRERSTPDSGLAPPQPAHAPQSAPLSGLVWTAASGSSIWEQWYHQASAEQRRQLLEQAGRQGLLCTHQLPPPQGQHDTPARKALQALLAGRPMPNTPAHSNLSPAPTEVSLIDVDLDDAQRLAVTRALTVPDVCLVLGYPGSGKSRVVAEILRQAARASQRVLLVAPAGPAVDHVLTRLAGEGGAGILRLLAAEETPQTLPAAAALLTLPERLRLYREQTLPAARAVVEQLQARVAARRAQVDLWPAVEEAVNRLHSGREELNRLQQRRDQLDAALQAELDAADGASVLRKAYEEVQKEGEPTLAAAEEKLARITAEREQVQQAQKQLEEESQHLHPLVEAKQSHRWWTSAWWKATVQGNPQTRLVEIAQELQRSADTLQALDTEHQQLTDQRQEILRRRDEKRKELLDRERVARLAELDGHLAKWRKKQEESEARLRSLADQLSPGVSLSADATLEAVHNARESWSRSTALEQQELEARRGWLLALEQAQPGLARELTQTAHIVAGTTTGLPAERLLAEKGGAEFDLLVVEDAHRVSEAELLALSGRARRCVLVGEPPAELPIAPSRKGERSRACPPFPFPRLWTALHSEPRRLPARWRHADGRLIALLRPLGPEQQAVLHREPVFDRPEIELGIVAAQGQDPCIVEVSFPEETPVAEAKEFIYRELQELPVQANSLMPRWHEGESAVTLELSVTSESPSCVAVLEEGVLEHVGRCSCAVNEGHWPTTAIEFTRSAGWDRARAERWVEERLGLRDCGQTVVLGRCHRARPPLARFLSSFLYGGACQVGGQPSQLEGAQAVQFVPVPAIPRGEPRRPSEPEPRWGGGGTATLTRARAVRGGAGLEVDLSDPRRPDAVPAELRPLLPSRGVINYLEACAVVAALEGLVVDPAFQEARTSWEREHKGSPVVGVMSLFPAQVELMRVLIGRSAVLAGVPVEVGLPAAFAQRECLVALLSLTRSHSNRAVPFSEHPRDLILALTRAAGRLIVFGDPGTMNRRSQWFGGLDHLDETAGPLEQALVGQLLVWVAEPEAPSRPSRNRESSGV